MSQFNEVAETIICDAYANGADQACGRCLQVDEIH